jgi:hypothetical protein
MTSGPIHNPDNGFSYGSSGSPWERVPFDEGITPVRVSYESAAAFLDGTPLTMSVFATNNIGIETPLISTLEMHGKEFRLLSEYVEHPADDSDTVLHLSFHGIQVRLFEKKAWRRQPSGLVTIDRYPDPAKIRDYMDIDSLLEKVSNPDGDA